MQVYDALVTATLPVATVDGITTTIYFASAVSSSAVHAVIDPLEWTNATLSLVSSDVDPYTQYLNTTRHDQPIRHELGVSVPRDTTKIDLTYLDTDGTLAANSDTKIASQKAVKTYADTKSPLESPTFIGTPAAPTAAADTDTTQIATTAFVLGQASDADPGMDGTADPGTSEKYSRDDHIHPTDTSRAASDHNHDGDYTRWRGSSATAPDSPSAGDRYYNSSETRFYEYDGSSWVTTPKFHGSLASDPSSAIGGDTYYNSTDSKPYFYTGSAWVALT
jgi:hypothetical protein